MDKIEKKLMDDFFAQEKTDDIDEYVKKNAPEEYLNYLKDYYAARQRLSNEGKIA